MLYGFKGCSRGWQLVNLTEFPQIALKFAKMADTFPYYLGSMLVYIYIYIYIYICFLSDESRMIAYRFIERFILLSLDQPVLCQGFVLNRAI